jgi:hypothetical protein
VTLAEGARVNGNHIPLSEFTCAMNVIDLTKPIADGPSAMAAIKAELARSPVARAGV